MSIAKSIAGLATGIMAANVVSAAPVVIDHTSVELYSQIPDSYVAAVKAMWLSVPGESHSLGYRKGCALLAAQEPRFAAQAQESGTPAGATTSFLRISRATWGDVGHSAGWRYGYGEEDWFTSATAISRTKAFIQYANAQSLGLSAVGFGWCWDATWHNAAGGTIDPVHQVRWAGSSVGGPQGDRRWGLDAGDTALTSNNVCLDTYLTATQSYVDFCKAGGLPTKVFFSTGAIDGYAGESGYQRHLKYERIRNYVRNSAANFLFDYADILSWNNAGHLYTRTWTDHGGRSQVYPMIHPDNMIDRNGRYVEDGDHIGELGAIRLAKATWVMLARMAGWQPGGGDQIAPTSPAPVVGSVLDQSTILLEWSASTDAGGPVGYEVYRDGALIKETEDTIHLDANLVPGRTYNYSVWAIDASENGTEATTTVTLSTAPGYILTTSGMGGSIQRSPDRASYSAGTTVILTAVADPRYTFHHWEGALTGSTNPVSVLVQGNAAITGIFIEDSSEIETGLSGQWRLDEGTGTIASDSSGNGRHGQLTNGAQWAAGVTGSAVLLDGTNDNLNLGTSTFGITNGFTISAWVRGTTIGGRRMTLAQRGEYVVPYSLRFDVDGRLQLRVRAGSSVASLMSTTVFRPNTWYHVATTFSGGQATIYINGEEDGRRTATGSLVVDAGEATSVGATPNAVDAFSGSVDALRIYNRALSASEILVLASPGKQ